MLTENTPPNDCQHRGSSFDNTMLKASSSEVNDTADSYVQNGL